MKSSTTTVFNISSSFYFFFFLFSSIFVSWSTLLLSHSVHVVFSLNSEGEALLSLLNRFSFESPLSIKLNWNNLSSSTSTPCDHWEGITCDTEKTHVVSLDLSYHQISGQLGPQVGQLTYLETIDLSYNRFTGGIPKSLCQISNLKSVDLSDNQFNGSIPKELWNCSHLQHLYLSDNDLTGELLEAVGNLHNLKSFSVFRNHLSGRIPESLFQISGLETVELRENNFTVSIPLNIGNATNMKILLLSSNQLHGNIPTSIANCTKLESLDLNDNGLSGEIPLGVWRIPTLATIDVGNNNLSRVQLPVEMTELRHLRYIDLSGNQFFGLIPEALGINNTNLEVVDFSNNSLSGEIPPNLCLIRKNLERLDLSENRMNGTLPHCLGDSNQLYTLNLRNNDFTGTIPPNFTSDKLQKLDLNGNRFEGKIPKINSQWIRYLDLGNNQLEDTFPFFLGEILSDLEVLVLRSNKLYGPLKSLHMSNSTFINLKVLDISSNYFTGDLPLEFGLGGLEAMKHIDDLSDLRQRLFYPSISTVVIHKGNEVRLNRTLLDYFRAIDMSNNRFQGRIPESIGDLSNLTMLNLSNNNFNGHIPSSLGNLIKLESLDLSQNKLSGEIPRHLTGIDSLAVLNFSYNNLTGRIPEGTHFSTFSNDSFRGNSGLCGFQISRKCGSDDSLDPIEVKQSYEDSNNNPWSFGWEPVVIGYGCGVLIGLVIQYFLFTKAFLYRWFG